MKISICSGFHIAAVAVAVITIVSFVGSEPVRGGYEDSLQNLGGYGAPYGGGNRDSGYGNEPANYDFQYEVFGGGNFFGHQESRRDQTAKGKYHVLLPDGRRQTVNYIADESGYHPVISYELVANPFDGPSGGYGNSKGPSSSSAGGYENSRGTSGGYGAPISDNNLGGYSSSPAEPGTRYGGRAKRQFLIASQLGDQSDDIVKIYKSGKNPEQRFRNRRRRFSPKKTYLIVYPNSPETSSIISSGQEDFLKLKSIHKE